ncbi:uncharacterized protein LOC126251979 [Schistocerca nitens]|uniref:uncharacterized protein LOC126251979 n=1 Tax=Schistocerca nitens TaxID=7011 RepID=UPI0021192C42|nr:uncharacterized protein LOC126251979 [Schistocerca nitens]
MVLSRIFIQYQLPLVFFSFLLACSKTVDGKNVLAVPQTVSLYTGQEVYVYMATGENLTECWLLFPNKTKIDLLQENVEYGVDYWGNDLSVGICGFHAKNLCVNATGNWILRAIDTQKITYQAITTINVFEYPDLHDQEVHLYLDSDGSFSGRVINLVPDGVPNETAVYCITHAPGDHLTGDFHYNGCSIYIGRHAKAYTGQWTYHLGIEGLTEELSYSLNVTLSEPHLTSGWELSTFNDGVIDVFCELEDTSYDEEIQHCYFTRPGDKKRLHVSNNVGNGDYFSYKVNHDSCHLMILNPSSLDYGLWFCVMKTSGSLYTSTVYVPGSQSMEKEDLFTNMKKEVVLGLPTFILCTSPYPLSSCFISSPNGEVFSGNKSHLQFGKCLLIIPTAEQTHNGTWRCQMYNETEINISTTELVVWENNFIAVTPLVSAVSGETTSILCRTVFTSRMTAPSLATCWFIHPDGTIISPLYNSSVLNSIYKYYGQGLDHGECGLTINAASKRDEGKWFCIGQLHGSLTETYAEVNVSIHESPNISPNEVSVSANEDIYFKLDVAVPINSSCMATTPNGTILDLLNLSSPDLRYWGLHSDSSECGIIIAEGSTSGTHGPEKWTLSAESPSGTKVTASAWKITIKDRETPLGQSKTIIIKIGDNVDLDCNETGALYCTFVPPNSNNKLLGPGPCTLTLDHVTAREAGMWTCYVGIKNMSKEFKKTIELVLEDETESVGWEKSDWQAGAVDLYCNVKRTLEYCRFVKPSGESFRVAEGLGISGLIYYGKGLQSGDCGITVSAMSEEDFGTWRCILGVSVEGTIETETRLINIHGTTKDEIKELKTDRRKEIVLVGSELFVSCQADHSLSYCWIRHPNGTRVNANTDLLSGSCMAVTIANMEDAGPWECHLGLPNEEKVIYIDVTVTGSRLFADKAVTLSGDSASFICHSVPTGHSLKYCRFVRPDGKGFRLTDASIYEHYSYNGAGLQYGDCGLKIHKPGQQDIGQWICAALILGERIEGSASVVITQEDSSWSLGAVIGTTVGVVMFVTGVAIFGVWYLRKKRKAPQQRHSTDAVSNTSSQEENSSP